MLYHKIISVGWPIVQSPAGGGISLPLVLLLLWGQIGMAICCVSQVMRRSGISLFCGAVSLLLFLILCFAFAAPLSSIDWSNAWADACKLLLPYRRCWLVCGWVCQWDFAARWNPRQTRSHHSCCFCIVFFSHCYAVWPSDLYSLVWQLQQPISVFGFLTFDGDARGWVSLLWCSRRLMI